MRRADLAERIDTVEQRMDSMEHRLDASFNALSTQILQSRCETNDAILALGADLRGEMKAMGADLRAAIKEGDEDSRGFMMILHEEVLSKFKLIGEGRPSAS